MSKNLKRTSKFLSLVLRHKPEVIDLSLDANGWADIGALLFAAQRHGHPLTKDLLDEVVFTNDKQRFAYSPDGSKIRANQGHSVTVNLELELTKPPLVLYHGTVAKFLESIRVSGLEKRNRQHVHLSATVETARRVGARRGEPVVLSVDARTMHEEGYLFYLSANGVWLTEVVPPVYIGELSNWKPIGKKKRG